MFERIIARLRAPVADFTSMPQADARHALGALLARVAKADGQRHDTEEKVVAIATQGFGMSQEAAAALRS